MEYLHVNFFTNDIKRPLRSSKIPTRDIYIWPFSHRKSVLLKISGTRSLNTMMITTRLDFRVPLRSHSRSRGTARFRVEYDDKRRLSTW